MKAPSTEQKTQSSGKYKPALRIDPKLAQAFSTTPDADIESGSITPTTLKSRTFSDLDVVSFVEHYSYSSSNVLRYGIHAQELTAKLDKGKGTLLGQKIELFDESTGGMSTVRSSKYGPKDAEKVTHHPLEKFLLQQAIDHLLEEGQGRNTVLVDIFARKDNAIKLEQGDIPEVHTVVLYKNPAAGHKHVVSVIDPSSFLFSSHLSNSDIAPTHKALEKIDTLHKNTQIYKPLTPTGSAPDQSRDCVDAAVKIAFGLNGKSDPINLKQVASEEAIIRLSNLTKIDASIIMDLPMSRIKQTSDVKTVSKFYALNKSLKKVFDLLKLTDQNLLKEGIIKYQSINTTTNIDILSKLLECHEESINNLSKFLQEEQVTLAGLPDETKTGD
jgi:hypothetical protein